MLNRCILIGRMTKDPEARFTQSNIAVTTFTIAVNRSYSKDGNTEADFISIITWRQLAENVAKYTRKGSLVAVDGRIQTRNYDDKNGRKVYITEVVADNVRFLDPKDDSRTQPGVDRDKIEALNKNIRVKDEVDPFFESSNIKIDDDNLPF